MLHREAADSAQPGTGRRLCLSLLCAALLSTSCRLDGERRYFLAEEKHADYIGHATQISYHEVDQPLSANVNFAIEPRRLGSDVKEEIWDLTLTEVIQIALSNSEVIRNSGQFLSPGNPILASPEIAPSTLDPAIQEAGVLFGRRGVEAALADFDTQFTTQMLWGRDENLQNNFISNGVLAGDTLVDETAQFATSFRKRLATGGQVDLSHSWNYTGRNINTINQGGTQLFSSVYDGNVRLQFRQPLLAGGGAEYTRIAGPVSTNIQGVTGVQQGVIIARINNDIALAEFERAVHQLIHDLEVAYWQLHASYRSYATLVLTRNQAMDAWRLVDAQLQANTGRGGAQEAEMRDAYLDLKGRASGSRDGLYAVEAELRRLMGLPVNDGRVIRPVDEPITAEFVPAWSLALGDALANRPEIRRQKWSIQSIELQLRAAENLTQPRLDFVSSYQVNGFGDNLLGGVNDGRSASGDLGNAYERLTNGDQTGWNLGLEFSVPFGRRFAKSQVRALEFELAKSQKMLEKAEDEISFEVASVFRDVDRTYGACQLAYNRFLTSQDRLEIAKAQYYNDQQRYSLDSVLRAIELFSQAELTLINAVTEYNTAIADLHFRTGNSLSVNGIHLSEGPWEPPAYHDALERYEDRKFAIPSSALETKPDINETGP